jgi:glutamate---cysteine ligase / carboxylate-amine ligase
MANISDPRFIRGAGHVTSGWPEHGSVIVQRARATDLSGYGYAREGGFPAWSDWAPSPPYSVGIEEEAMLLDPQHWALEPCSDRVLPSLPATLASRVTAETHEAAIELATAPHLSVHDTTAEASSMRAALVAELDRHGVRVAAAGTHPFAIWAESQVSRAARYQLVYESMRELARREPTFALHVHIGVPERDRAVELQNRLRAHLPLLLALSVNSPFWQGRDTGLASARTSIFQAFPRVGIPRVFSSYEEYVEAVDTLLRCDAFPEPTFLWWDVRMQPRFGTVEVRIMDAQTNAARSGALAALVQAIAHLELEEGYHHDRLIEAAEVLEENRFLAARDGMDARFIDPVAERRVPATEQLNRLLEAARPHAQDLGSESALETVVELARETGAARQRRVAKGPGLPGLVAHLAADFP